MLLRPRVFNIADTRHQVLQQQHHATGRVRSNQRIAQDDYLASRRTTQRLCRGHQRHSSVIDDSVLHHSLLRLSSTLYHLCDIGQGRGRVQFTRCHGTWPGGFSLHLKAGTICVLHQRLHLHRISQKICVRKVEWADGPYWRPGHRTARWRRCQWTARCLWYDPRNTACIWCLTAYLALGQD
jgi:hypothetical protein